MQKYDASIGTVSRHKKWLADLQMVEESSVVLGGGLRSPGALLVNNVSPRRVPAPLGVKMSSSCSLSESFFATVSSRLFAAAINLHLTCCKAARRRSLLFKVQDRIERGASRARQPPFVRVISSAEATPRVCSRFSKTDAQTDKASQQTGSSVHSALNKAPRRGKKLV